MPILSTLKPKCTAESTNATAAGLGRMIWWCTNTTMKTCHNSVITSGNGMRGGMGAMGSGRGSPMLYQMFRPSVAAGLKTCMMMMMTCSTVPTALATIKTYAAIPASSSHTFGGAVECGHPFPITCNKTLFLHKRKAHLDSQVKCCFASPESERTAFAYCDSSENLLSLRNQSSLSTALNKSPGSLLSSRFLSLVGFNNPSNFFNRNLLGSYQFRNLNTSAFNMAQSNGSLARQNFHEDCEAHINKQINMELYASYVYMSMAYYFDREDVAFPGLHKWFKKASDEEREHAEKFMKYQNMRGGRIVLQPIGKPSLDEWNSPLDALSAALELERTVNQTLLGLHGVAGQHNDPQLCDFLETNFLEEQVHAIKELSDYVTRLKRVGKGLGEHMFDNELGSKAD